MSGAMICVLGSVNIDFTMFGTRLPGPGETVAGHGFLTSPGGKGANQALAAARAGARVEMAGAVGDDAFADPALAGLKAAGVGLDHVARRRGATGAALILVDDSGENAIMVHPGANGAVDAALAGTAMAGLGRGDVLLLQQEIPLPAIREGLRRARAAGATGILNIAPLTEWSAETAAAADIVIGNEHELAELGRVAGIAAEDPAGYARLAEHYHCTIVATLGAEGAVALRRGHDPLAVPAPKVTAVDTVGAGDTFCGYLAAGLEAGRDLETAMRVAVAAASLACTKPGAQAAIPRMDEVEAVLRPRPRSHTHKGDSQV